MKSSAFHFERKHGLRNNLGMVVNGGDENPWTEVPTDIHMEMVSEKSVLWN